MGSIFMDQPPGKTVWQLVSKNSGALIIGASLIVALNFAQITDWLRYASYHLSGQAAADKRAREEQLAGQREQEAQAEQKRREAGARQEREDSALANLDAAWQQYLVASKPKFKQIVIVRDTQKGDYACLRIIYGQSPWEQYRFDEAKERAREQMRAEWTYEIRDRIADGFAQWLNTSKLWGKIDWRYDDLGNSRLWRYWLRQTRFIFDPKDDPHPGAFDECLFPDEIWRANRYQKRIDER
jgi:hypothetical protein